MTEKPLPFDGADGVRYRVFDATYGLTPFKWRRFPIGDARARTRVFVPPDAAAMLRVYTFLDGEDRTPEPDALARQLLHAAWAPREFPATPTHHGGRPPNTGGG